MIQFHYCNIFQIRWNHQLDGDRCCPLRIGLRDPFQMAELHGL